MAEIQDPSELHPTDLGGCEPAAMSKRKRKPKPLDRAQIIFLVAHAMRLLTAIIELLNHHWPFAP